MADFYITLVLQQEKNVFTASKQLYIADIMTKHY